MSRARAGAKLLLAGAMLAGGTGCEHHFFKVDGTIRSQGGQLGSWSATPEGCSRDPLAEFADGEPQTFATFVWQDPKVRDELQDKHPATRQKAPLRLELSRSGSQVAGRLETTETQAGDALDRNNCGTLEMTGSEGKPVISGGKPTLRGTVALDCQVQGSHITASLRFSGCEY